LRGKGEGRRDLNTNNLLLGKRGKKRGEEEWKKT